MTETVHMPEHLQFSMLNSLQNTQGKYLAFGEVKHPDHREYDGIIASIRFLNPTFEKRFHELEDVARAFITLNDLVAKQHKNDIHVVRKDKRMAWAITEAYELVLGYKDLRVGTIGYHGKDNNTLFDSSPNIEWAVKTPRLTIGKTPLPELDDAQLIRYVLHRLSEHDCPF